MIKPANKLFAPTPLKRFQLFFFSDVLMIAFSLYLSFLLRLEFRIGGEYQALMVRALPLFIIVKLLFFAVFRLYRITWRYVSINDFFNIFNALLVANSTLMAIIVLPLNFLSGGLLPQLSGFPRSIFIIDGIMSLFLISLVRISKRLFLEVINKTLDTKGKKKTVIVGAGNTGEMVLRDMMKYKSSEFCPVALLDDDENKIGAYVHGVKVLGTTNELSKAIAACRAEAVIIAIPSLDHKALRSIYNAARESRVDSIKIVPRIYDVHRPAINLKALEEISITDLIGRQAISINYREVEQFLRDKVILITGGGGSIGSEIARQVCVFHPRRLVLFDMDETALHNMQLLVKKEFPDLTEIVQFIAGDIRDEYRVSEVMDLFSPDIVFHAAAYKHVPMMEHNPKEAVKVNMFGTYTVARAAKSAGVKKFVMISTDKAVRPTSIMGATKRMAEHICKAMNSNGGIGTEFVSVRFGNVLGSRGSVLPLFLAQLKYGGPLTVTHRDMLRYFMTIPEAVSLVLQASVIGGGGEVLALDMGEPVKVLELAEELIRIHGLEPYKDINIEFIGPRPGEKLFEEILTAEEGTAATKHEKVFISKNSEKYTMEEMQRIMGEFASNLAQTPTGENSMVRDLLKQYVRHFEVN
ncbi:MAG: polysaccharide biosynthesis protein [Nitrospirae bacterium]|nr:polysaccharide biosynthesis protein [Nitrospirota bacterium]